MQARSRGAPGLSRRAWLAGLVLGWAGRSRADDEPRPDPAEERDIAEVQARARKAGLGMLRSRTTAHYLGLGDAPAKFQSEALGLCEGLAQDYLKHFKDKGFAIEPPGRRLTLVILAGAREFAAFLGEEQPAEVGGIYDLDTNRLVIFDNRAEGGARAARANSVTLFHEATHQLTFNTGLLDRRGDVPLCISEGLAMYGEVRRPGGRASIGAVNAERLPLLVQAVQSGRGWVPVRDLFANETFEGGESQQLAYAESWLLVSYLLRTKARLPGFRAYLEAIRGRRDASKRLQDAQAHLGDLAKLDAALARYAIQLMRG
jgi:hypothetical protein